MDNLMGGSGQTRRWRHAVRHATLDWERAVQFRFWGGHSQCLTWSARARGAYRGPVNFYLAFRGVAVPSHMDRYQAERVIGDSELLEILEDRNARWSRWWPGRSGRTIPVDTGHDCPLPRNDQMTFVCDHCGKGWVRDQMQPSPYVWIRDPMINAPWRESHRVKVMSTVILRSGWAVRRHPG